MTITTIRNLLISCLSAVLVAPASAQSPAQNAKRSSTYSATAGTSTPAFPLKLSANHRYLVDQKNKPFLIVGDSPQGLMGRLSPDEVEKYFADRQAHGFNTAGWIDVACAGKDFPDNTTAGTYDGILPFTGLRCWRYRLHALRSLEAQRSVLCATRSCDRKRGTAWHLRLHRSRQRPSAGWRRSATTASTHPTPTANISGDATENTRTWRG